MLKLYRINTNKTSSRLMILSKLQECAIMLNYASKKDSSKRLEDQQKVR